MATVISANPSVNSTSAAAPAASSYVAPSMADVWAALAYVSGKEGDRDALPDGALRTVDLSITGSVDGCEVSERVVGRLTVGHASEKASSSTPNISHILAAMLAKLNKATRAKVLAELPEDYAAGGQALPNLAVGDVADAENLLASLRQTKRVSARGPVKCEYALHGQAAGEDRPAVAGRIGNHG